MPVNRRECMELPASVLESARPEALPDAEASLAGVPIFVRYQSRWWLKVEGVLDAEETR
jgi:hypothetical protein